MNKLAWKNEYCVGNETIDAEHKRLFGIANEILNINNPIMETPKIMQLVKQLYDYMQTHFEHEEVHMESISFTEIEKHKAMHESIVEKMNAILIISNNYIQLHNLLATLMKQWVRKHIVEEDVKHCTPQGVKGRVRNGSAFI